MSVTLGFTIRIPFDRDHFIFKLTMICANVTHDAPKTRPIWFELKSIIAAFRLGLHIKWSALVTTATGTDCSLFFILGSLYNHSW